MKNKQNYEAPETELVKVKTERNFLASVATVSVSSNMSEWSESEEF